MADKKSGAEPVKLEAVEAQFGRAADLYHAVREDAMAAMLPVVVHADDVTARYVLRGPAGELLEREYPQAHAARRVTVEELGSLVAYLAQYALMERTLVTVTACQVEADLMWGLNAEHRVVMPLSFAPEYKALLNAVNLGQKALFKVLCTDLAKVVPLGLRHQMATLQVDRSSSATVEMGSHGAAAAQGRGETLVIRTKGADGASRDGELEVSWEYNGPVFECIRDYEVTLEVRLWVEETERGALAFSLLAPERMTAERDALEVIEGRISDALSELPEGNLVRGLAQKKTSLVHAEV